MFKESHNTNSWYILPVLWPIKKYKVPAMNVTIKIIIFIFVIFLIKKNNKSWKPRIVFICPIENVKNKFNGNNKLPPLKILSASKNSLELLVMKLK